MLANYLIGLREGLEASLVVVILLAYLARTGRRDALRWVWLGLGLAVAASLAVGALLTYGPRGLTFEAQEAIGGVLSIVTVALVTWMLLWMAQAARTLSAGLRGAVDAALDVGPSRLILVAALAVGREGLETALFLWAATNAATRASTSTTAPLLGAALGLITAVTLGALVHRGALKLDLARFFRWTGAALVLVAGGVLAYGVHDLQEAGILPGLNTLAFDVSGAVAADSALAVLVKGVLNLSPAMTVLETVVWVAYVVPVLLLFFTRLRRTPATPSTTSERVPA